MRKKLNQHILKPLGFQLVRNKPGYHFVPDIYGHNSYKLVDSRKDIFFKENADKVIVDKTTTFYYDRLYVIYQALKNIKSKNPVIVEAGVYKGGSSYFMAAIAKNLFGECAKIFSIDTFEGHSEKDLPLGKEGHHVPNWFNDTDYESVKQYLNSFPFVRVIKNRVQDAVASIDQGPYSLVHLDMDIYEPTKFSLDFFGQKMLKGGIIVLDDYGFKNCPGIKRAVDEYKGFDNFIKFYLQSGQALLIKIN